MTEIAQVEAAPIFRTRTVTLLLLLGIVGFLGMLLIGAYAPDIKGRSNGGGHALSNGATGYSGLVRLAEATGRHPYIVRSGNQFDMEDLLVVTPTNGSVDISNQLARRRTKPTLFVLPKWKTVRDRGQAGWIRYDGMTAVSDPEGVLAPGVKINIRQTAKGGDALASAADLPAAVRFGAPNPIQVISDITFENGWPGKSPPTRWQSLVTDGSGGTVVAQIGNGPLYVISDPDLLSNSGMKSVAQASAALALLDWMNSNDPDGIAFDVTAAGIGESPSPLKLIFEPPFLAATLTIAAALLLTALHALGRFGPIRAPGRAIAFGKAALVDNSAALIRKARREAGLGDRYAAMVRERAAVVFAVPSRLRGEELDHYLDGLERGEKFSDLAAKADRANDRPAVLAAAQALHAWLKGGQISKGERGDN